MAVAVVPPGLSDWWRRDWDRPAPTAAQQRLDVLIGVGAAVVTLAVVEMYRSWVGAPLGWRGVEAYLWFGLAGLLLVGRRRFPLLVLLAESAIFIVVGERLVMLATTFPIQIILFTSLYSAWAWSRRPRLLQAVTAVVLVAMFGWLLWSLTKPEVLSGVDHGGLLDPRLSAVVYSLLLNVLYFFGAIAWGHTAWRGARERTAAEQRTALELALAEHERERAVSDERVRIARDLHDVVAHHVSSIGVQAAGAQRMLDVDPDAARGVLATISDSSREAVTQMHQLVHLLRASGEPGTRAPQPGVADLATLTTTGPTPPVVEHRVVGEPFALPDTTSQSLFRIAQEAVTNVRRHAAARRATVVLRYVAEPRAVEIEVVDDGRGAGDAAEPARSPAASGDPARTGGFGLTGIRERTALHHGEAEIGPRPRGGFRVRVRIPVPDAGVTSGRPADARAGSGDPAGATERAGSERVS